MTTKLKYKHLNKQTNLIMEKSHQEKMKWARSKHFVYYPKAQKCIEQLGWIFEQRVYEEDDDFPSDLEGLTIIGKSGAGKTSIYQEFLRLHTREHHLSYEGVPVAYCLLRDSITGLKGLYSALLSPYGHPYADAETLKIERVGIDQFEDVLISVLKESGTRLYFIDEFQHAKGRFQQAILNQIKRTMLVSRVPFIPVGTPDIKNVLNLDPQLADRCPTRDYSNLEYWIFGVEFRSFLKGYESFLPFPEPSGLSGKDLALKIFNKVKFKDREAEKTNLRHIARFLMRVASKSLTKNLSRIEEDIIDKTTL